MTHLADFLLLLVYGGLVLLPDEAPESLPHHPVLVFQLIVLGLVVVRLPLLKQLHQLAHLQVLEEVVVLGVSEAAYLRLQLGNGRLHPPEVFLFLHQYFVQVEAGSLGVLLFAGDLLPILEQPLPLAQLLLNGVELCPLLLPLFLELLCEIRHLFFALALLLLVVLEHFVLFQFLLVYDRLRLFEFLPHPHETLFSVRFPGLDPLFLLPPLFQPLAALPQLNRIPQLNKTDLEQPPPPTSSPSGNLLYSYLFLALASRDTRKLGEQKPAPLPPGPLAPSVTESSAKLLDFFSAEGGSSNQVDRPPLRFGQYFVTNGTHNFELGKTAIEFNYFAHSKAAGMASNGLESTLHFPPSLGCHQPPAGPFEDMPFGYLMETTLQD